MFLVLANLVLACGGEPVVGAEGADGGAAGPQDTGEAAEVVDPVQWVTRASLDLRGVRPSVAELEQASQGLDAAEALVAAFADDPRLGTRIAWLYDDHLRTAVFFPNSPNRDFGALDEDAQRAVGWAPLELLRWIIDEDQPLTELVLAEELPRNDVLAAALDWSPTGTGADWVLAPHDDARPAAGLLSSTSLWLVYDGDRTNRHRRRANAVARIFLCDDLLERDLSVEFDLAAEDLVDLENAVLTEPDCLSCHAVLDPLASLFGGFAERSDNASIEVLSRYSAWSADENRVGVHPAAFGQPVGELDDLGRVLAADPRLPRCAAQTLGELLTGQSDLAPDLVDAWTQALVQQDGLVLRELLRRIVTDPVYASQPERVLRPEQLPPVLAELLGLDEQDESLQRLTWQTEHRLLGGSTDDALVVEANHEPTVGSHALMTWVARTVAVPALQQDAARAAGDRVLWTAAEPWATQDEAVRAQLAAWSGRFLSEPVDVDAAEVDRLYGLWLDAGGPDQAETAWTVVLHAFLRHPRFLIY